MDTTELERPGSWHFGDLSGLPDDGRRYEVVDGLLVVSPPPTPWHQFVAAGLLRQLDEQSSPEWHVLYEVGLQLGRDGRVPDLAVVHALAPIATAAALGPEHFGLVVEVVSASSRKTDRFAKPGEYAEAGIPLYWRVETQPDLLLVSYELRSGSYTEVAAVSGVGTVPAPWGDARIDLDSLRAHS